MSDTDEITQGAESQSQLQDTTVVDQVQLDGGESRSSQPSEGLEDSHDGNIQQIQIIPADGSNIELEDDGSGEPATKKIRLVQEDGQILVLAVGGQDAGQLSEVSDYSAALGSVVNPRQNIPGVNTDVSQAWFTKKTEKNALHQTGHTWKQGQWSKEEIELLQSNILLYCKERNISDPTEIIFEMNKDERKDFYRCIAQGLDRPLFSVYRRVIRMYDQKNYMGKYTPEEIEKLKELRKIHGTDWATIGAALGRSASSVKDRCRLMKDTCMTGKWLPAEEKRLAEAVYELSAARPGENVTSGLSWSAVAERVGTRSEKQCRSKWLNYLNWKQQGGTEWTREDDVNLVLKIADSGVQDETQLDWNDLAKNWSSVRSPQWLRGKWWSLKRHVPDNHVLSFTAIVKHLTEYHSQNIRSKNPSMRFSHSPCVSVMSAHGLTLHPVAVNAGGNAITTLATDESENNFQAYELIQQIPTSGRYLITQPQSHPSISFAAGTMATDHIIVHTLPVVQGKNVPFSSLQDSYHDNEAIQSMASSDMQHVIISSDVQSTPDESEIITSPDSAIGEIISTSQGSFESVDESAITTTSPTTMPEDGASLVIRTSEENTVTETKTSNRDFIMSSLSDPMLASVPDSSQLMGPDCEVVTGKVQSVDS